MHWEGGESERRNAGSMNANDCHERVEHCYLVRGLNFVVTTTANSVKDLGYISRITYAHLAINHYFRTLMAVLCFVATCIVLDQAPKVLPNIMY